MPDGFPGTELPETGKSFCPDCVVSDPVVTKFITAHPTLTLVEVPSGLRVSSQTQ